MQPGQHIQMDVLGLKLKVAGDAILDSDSWMPQIAVGLEHKQVRPGSLQSVFNFLGVKDTGTDVYVNATKLFLGQGPGKADAAGVAEHPECLGEGRDRLGALHGALGSGDPILVDVLDLAEVGAALLNRAEGDALAFRCWGDGGGAAGRPGRLTVRRGRHGASQLYV